MTNECHTNEFHFQPGERKLLLQLRKVLSFPRGRHNRPIKVQVEFDGKTFEVSSLAPQGRIRLDD